MDALGKKTNSRSFTWNYFTLKLDGDGKLINKDRQVCLKCKISISMNCENTNNTFHHLRDDHSCMYKEASMHQKLGSKLIESINLLMELTQQHSVDMLTETID